MFAASHIAMGALIFEALRDEKRPWVQAPLAVGGFFVSHWMLDLNPCYHDMNWPFNAFKWFIFAFNVVFVALIWWATCKPKQFWIPPPRVLWGLFGGWLLWDVWWFIEPGGGPHRLLVIWDGIPKWQDPESFLLEALFIALVTLLSLPAIDRWWKTSPQAQWLRLMFRRQRIEPRINE
jgi:hypothetical protein